jgi:hypothetical protein
MSAGFLGKLEGTLDSPKSAGLLGLAAGMAQASAPHRLPVPLMAAIGQGVQTAQAMRAASLKNALQQAVLPLKQTLTSEVVRAVHGKPLIKRTKPSVVPFPGKNGDKPQTPIDTLRAYEQARRNADARSLIFSVMGDQPAAGAQYTQNPAIQAALARAKALNTVMKIRGGEGAAFPGQAPLNFIPKLGAGQTLTPQGTVAVPPGFMRTSAGVQSLDPLLAAMYHAGMPIQTLTGARPQSVAQNLGLPQNPAQAAKIARLIAAQRSGILPQQGAPQPLVRPSGQGQQPKTLGQPLGAPTQAQNGQTPAQANPLAAGLLPSTGPASTSVRLTPSQVALETEASKAATGYIKEGAESRIALGNIAELDSVLQRFKTGPGSEPLVQIKSLFSGIGRVFGVPPPQTGDITSAQVLRKSAIQLAGSVTASLGQKAEGAFETVLHAVPNVDNTNMANAIVTGALAAAARYRIARATYTQSWLEAHNGNAVVPGRGTVGGYWTQHVPFMAFFMESLPEKAQAEILKAAQKNAPLRQELAQAAGAYSWLKSGGYL